MKMWDRCAICGKYIPLGEPCYGVKNWRGDPIGGDTICRDCLVPENAPTLAPPTEWISIEDRLPEECADILLCRKILKIPEIGTYRQARFWVYDEIGDVYQVDDITHWMPIPTLYDIDHIHISEPTEG